jgi:hypothetical protein
MPPPPPLDFEWFALGCDVARAYGIAIMPCECPLLGLVGEPVEPVPDRNDRPDAREAGESAKLSIGPGWNGAEVADADAPPSELRLMERWWAWCGWCGWWAAWAEMAAWAARVALAMGSSPMRAAWRSCGR